MIVLRMTAMSQTVLPVLGAPLYLVVTQGPWAGALIPMKVAQFLIGRGPDCHLRPTSTNVEERHCGILADKGRFFVCDLKSRTGTFLNDRQIFGKVELLNEDQLRIGPLEFHINIPAHEPQP